MNLEQMKEEAEKTEQQLKQLEANYHQVQGGLNMLKHLIKEQEEPVKAKK